VYLVARLHAFGGGADPAAGRQRLDAGEPV
jgi:hypothetical protein